MEKALEVWKTPRFKSHKTLDDKIRLLNAKQDEMVDALNAIMMHLDKTVVKEGMLQVRQFRAKTLEKAQTETEEEAV